MVRTSREAQAAIAGALAHDEAATHAGHTAVVDAVKANAATLSSTLEKIRAGESPILTQTRLANARFR